MQVTRTTIKSGMSSKFGKIRQPTVELAALDRLEKSPYTYNGRKVVTTFDLILFILACNEDIHKSLDEFEFPPDPTTDYRVNCP